MALVKAKIRVGHSPDPDDAFMLYAIAHNKVESDGITFSHVIEDIESLNRRAFKSELEVTAVSVFAFFQIAKRYALMPCGASIGDKYGPVLVATKSLYPKDLAGKKIAVPGLNTTAYLALKLFLPDFEAVVVPFDQILDSVKKGEHRDRGHLELALESSPVQAFNVFDHVREDNSVRLHFVVRDRVEHERVVRVGAVPHTNFCFDQGHVRL